MSTVAVEVAERVRFEAQLLRDLVDPDAPWRYQHAHRGGAASRASYELAISMPEAPEAMAVLRGYVDFIGLTGDHAWSVSAMPSYRGDTSEQRFATITSGSRELAYVWFETATGLVTTWGLRVPPPCPEPRSALAWLEETDGEDITVAGEGVSGFFEVLAEPAIADKLRETAALRVRRGRVDWNNPWLRDLLAPEEPATGKTVTEGPGPAGPTSEEVARKYAVSVTRRRLHQMKFRALVLAAHGTACTFCGHDLPAIIEAPHLVADRDGGAASSANGRPLCPNHHAAFDAGLLEWDPHRQIFAAARDTTHIPPSPIR